MIAGTTSLDTSVVIRLLMGQPADQYRQPTDFRPAFGAFWVGSLSAFVSNSRLMPAQWPARSPAGPDLA